MAKEAGGPRHDHESMAQEVIAFSVAFALSLAISVAVVELIWGLI
jgi:hypothetical protein